MGCFKPSKEDEDEKVRREANRRIEKQLQKDKQAYRATHRLLLLGLYQLLIVPVLSCLPLNYSNESILLSFRGWGYRDPGGILHSVLFWVSL